MEDTMKVLLLIRSYQTNGYLAANLDPLNMENDEHVSIFQNRVTLDFKNYGFTEEDLDREFMIYTDQIQVITSLYLRESFLKNSLLSLETLLKDSAKHTAAQ
jgi:2-oxoglutarate dehydrogenase complex dehydrogenase (E1) component-like enzyme